MCTGLSASTAVCLLLMTRWDRPAMAHPFVATMIGGDLEGLRSLAAVAGRKPTPFHGADGADALQGIGQQWPIRSGGGLEGCGPSQPCGRKSTPFHGADGADALKAQGGGQQWVHSRQRCSQSARRLMALYPLRRLKAAMVRSVSRLMAFSFRSWRLSIAALPRPIPISTFTRLFFQ